MTGRAHHTHYDANHTILQMQLNSLRHRLIALLESPVSNRISFSYPHGVFRPGGYAALALRLRAFEVARNLRAFGQLPHPQHSSARQFNIIYRPHLANHGAAAEYDPSANKIAVPNLGFGATILDQGSLVHEATHAILDSRRVRMGAIQNEAVAYIAQHIFQIHSGVPPYGAGQTGIHVVAREVASSVTTPLSLLSPWSTTVTAQQFNRLVTTIQHDSLYQPFAGRRAQHDGIPLF